MFHLELGLKDDNQSEYKIHPRMAVKGLAVREDKLLLVVTSYGDYKIPGGGVNEKEAIEETLTREFLEETGYKIRTVGKKLGSIIERKIDKYEENTIFEMTSHYYLCEISDDVQVEQNLDEYETKQGFSPIWVTIEEAILNNEALLKEGESDTSYWVYRETLVLKEFLKEQGIKTF